MAMAPYSTSGSDMAQRQSVTVFGSLTGAAPGRSFIQFLGWSGFWTSWTSLSFLRGACLAIAHLAPRCAECFSPNACLGKGGQLLLSKFSEVRLGQKRRREGEFICEFSHSRQVALCQLFIQSYELARRDEGKAQTKYN